MRIADVFVGVRADLSEFNRAVSNLSGNVGQATSNIGRNLTNVGRGMTNVGNAMTANLTLPILAVGGATSKLALDFDTTMRQIVGLTDITEQQIGDIRDEILKMGPEIGKGPQELAEAFYFIASGGIEASKQLDVLRQAAESSASGLGSTQSVAQVLVGVLNAYGQENISASKAADILTEAVSQGTAEADAFAGVIGRVVPAAAALGVEFDDVTAAIAGMTLTGLSAEEAAVGLNQVFISLLKPTTQASDAMAELGLNAADLRRQLREEGLLSTLRTLEERFAGNEEASAAVFGNVRALRSVTSLLTLDTDQLNSVFEKVEDSAGRAAQGYEETEGPARELGRAMADLEAVGIELGTDVLPTVVDVLRRVADGAREFGKWWRELDDDTKANIIQWALWLAIAGPVLSIVGKLVTGVGGLVKAVGFLTTKIPLLGAALSKILGPLALLVAAHEAYLAITEGTTDATASEIVQLQNLANATGDGRKAMDQLKDAAKELGKDGISELIGPMVAAMETGMSWEEALVSLGATAGDTGQAFSNMGQFVAENMGGVPTAVQQGVNEASLIAAGLSPELAGILTAGSEEVGDAAALTAEEITKALEDAKKHSVEQMQDLISQLATTLATGPEQIEDEAQALADALAAPYEDLTRRADLEAQLSQAAMIQAIDAGDSGLQARVFQQVNEWLAQYELLEPGAIAAGELINPAFQNGIDSNLQATLDWVRDNVAAPYLDTMTLDEALDRLGYSGLAAYSRAVDKAQRTELYAAVAAARAQMNRLNIDGTSWGAGFIGTFTAGMWSKYNALSEAAGAMAAKLRGTFQIRSEPPDPNSPLRGVTKWGGNFIDTLIAGMLGRSGALTATARSLAGLLAMTPAYAGMTGVRPGFSSLSAATPSNTAPVGGNTINVYMQDKLPAVTSPRDIGDGLRMLEQRGHLTPRTN